MISISWGSLSFTNPFLLITQNYVYWSPFSSHISLVYSDSYPCLTETYRRCPWCWSSLPSFGERRQVWITFFSNWPRHLSCIPAAIAVLFPFSSSLLASSPTPLLPQVHSLHTGVHLLLRSTSLVHFYWKVFLRNDAYACACFFSLCQAPWGSP